MEIFTIVPTLKMHCPDDRFREENFSGTKKSSHNQRAEDTGGDKLAGTVLKPRGGTRRQELYHYHAETPGGKSQYASGGSFGGGQEENTLGGGRDEGVDDFLSSYRFEAN